MREPPPLTRNPIPARLRRLLAAITMLGLACTSLACGGTGRPQPVWTRQLPQLPSVVAEPTIPALVAEPGVEPTAVAVGVASPQVPVLPPSTESVGMAPDGSQLPSGPPPATPTPVAGSVDHVPTQVPTEAPVIEPTITSVIPTETPPPEAADDPDAGRAEDMLDELLNLLDNADSLDDLLD
ncbi:hypothetical protein ACFLT5_00665 [Chloroflexota bacterium]